MLKNIINFYWKLEKILNAKLKLIEQSLIENGVKESNERMRKLP